MFGTLLNLCGYDLNVGNYDFINACAVEYHVKMFNKFRDNKWTVDRFMNELNMKSIDEGVSDLVNIAVEKGRHQNKNLKLGICGEHGGDPKSINFCSKAGLNYVSCSPFRVPIARLAAAQAELRRQL